MHCALGLCPPIRAAAAAAAAGAQLAVCMRERCMGRLRRKACQPTTTAGLRAQPGLQGQLAAGRRWARTRAKRAKRAAKSAAELPPARRTGPRLRRRCRRRPRPTLPTSGASRAQSWTTTTTATRSERCGQALSAAARSVCYGRAVSATARSERCGALCVLRPGAERLRLCMGGASGPAAERLAGAGVTAWY